MSLDEMMAVLQAAKSGKRLQIQGRSKNDPWNGEWHDANPIEYNFSQFNYRVKPEPREGWVNRAMIFSLHPPTGTLENYVKVREVLD